MKSRKRRSRGQTSIQTRCEMLHVDTFAPNVQHLRALQQHNVLLGGVQILLQNRSSQLHWMQPWFHLWVVAARQVLGLSCQISAGPKAAKASHDIPRTPNVHISGPRRFKLEKSETQKDQDQRCQSRPSAKNSVVPREGDSSKNYGADQQTADFGSSFLQIPHASNICWWKIRFKTEVCTCSQFFFGSRAVDQRSGDG